MGGTIPTEWHFRPVYDGMEDKRLLRDKPCKNNLSNLPKVLFMETTCTFLLEKSIARNPSKYVM